MREILFRGKLTANGEWTEGNLVVNRRGICIITPDETPIGTYGQVDPETVGQYTGLTDKNGEKIFEGDIVAGESHGYIPYKFIGDVVFSDGCYGIQYASKFYGKDAIFHRIGESTNWQEMGASGTITYTYEIVGNIHDNPELLGGVGNSV